MSLSSMTIRMAVMVLVAILSLAECNARELAPRISAGREKSPSVIIGTEMTRTYIRNDSILIDTVSVGKNGKKRFLPAVREKLYKRDQLHIYKWLEAALSSEPTDLSMPKEEYYFGPLADIVVVNGNIPA